MWQGRAPKGRLKGRPSQATGYGARRESRGSASLMVWTAPPRRHQSTKAWPPERHKEGIVPAKFIKVGVDLGNNYFQVHALEREDFGMATRKLSRRATRKLFSKTRPCRAGMEACGSALPSQTKGLGARTSGDGLRGALDPAGLRQALWQARQQRCRRDRAAAMARRAHVFRASQQRKEPSGIDAAHNARAARSSRGP